MGCSTDIVPAPMTVSEMRELFAVTSWPGWEWTDQDIKTVLAALSQSESGAAALRQMALALIYVDGTEVRETARRELDNIQAGAEFIAQLEDAKRAIAESERSREKQAVTMARYAQSLQEVKAYAQEIERSVPPGDGQGCAVNIQNLVDATFAGTLPPTLDFLNAAERGRLEWFQLCRTAEQARDAALAECARLRISLRSIRTATNIPLPSQQIGPEWESCSRVPIQRLSDIDEVLDRALGKQVVTDEPMPELHQGPRSPHDGGNPDGAS